MLEPLCPRCCYSGRAQRICRRGGQFDIAMWWPMERHRDCSCFETVQDAVSVLVEMMFIPSSYLDLDSLRFFIVLYPQQLLTPT